MTLKISYTYTCDGCKITSHESGVVKVSALILRKKNESWEFDLCQDCFKLLNEHLKGFWKTTAGKKTVPRKIFGVF